MRKTLKFLIASGACLVLAGTGQMSAQAAMNLETDAPVAGASVAINNYYASSLNPEKELAEAFVSKEVLAVAGAGQTGVAGGAQTAKPAQVAAETKAQPKETTGETEAVVRAMSKSIYDNIAISRVTNYVNVRAQASTGSEVVGKIYNNCAATILDTVASDGFRSTLKPSAFDPAKKDGNLSAQIISQEQPVSETAALNPDWVEWLMGFPKGWTDVSSGPPSQKESPA